MTLVGSGFLLSFILVSCIGFGLYAIGEVTSPLFIAIILASTSLGVVIPILKDAGESSTNFGQLVIAGATLGEFGSIILISLVIFGVQRATWFMKMLQRFQDSTPQISVRFALTLLVGFVCLAYGFGAEAILGAFLAGVVFRSVYYIRKQLKYAHFSESNSKQSASVIIYPLIA